MASNTSHQRSGSRGSPRAHTIDIPETKTTRGISTRAAAVASYYEGLGGADGPGFFTYPNFLCYLSRKSTAFDRAAFSETFALMAKGLLDAADGSVYLADGMAFTDDVLRDEFPELSLFRLSMADAFAESHAHPGVFIETRRFADLHLLSRMRRELRHTGLVADKKAIDVVKALLGIDECAKVAA
jgi:hypothetical protein